MDALRSGDQAQEQDLVLLDPLAQQHLQVTAYLRTTQPSTRQATSGGEYER